jgi:hypothetical protein
MLFRNRNVLKNLDQLSVVEKTGAASHDHFAQLEPFCDDDRTPNDVAGFDWSPQRLSSIDYKHG